ncbi:MAG: hypothetical protein AB7G47_01975 [Mycolicibacterium sp.]|uniref:hypothetical protein n=1 Tax=Mycolicibacterium sp. TaxID=2320850 RepID=UPI003D14AADE
MTILLPRSVVIDDAPTSDPVRPQDAPRTGPEQADLPASHEHTADQIADDSAVPASRGSRAAHNLYLTDARLAREMSRDGCGDPAPSYAQYVGCVLLILLILIVALGSL